MIETFRNAWKVPELKKKLLFTFFIIIIYRIGGAIPVPYLDAAALSTWFEGSQSSGDFFSYLNVLSGGNFSKATLLALSVSPYINAQIIIQLLTYALPPLEKLSKEGPEGRKKINRITKYTALGIALFQAWAYYITLDRSAGALMYTTGWQKWFAEIVIIACFTAGASLTIWLGDQISEKGIGNGISMLLFAGIIARGPSGVYSLISLMKTGEAKYMILVPIIIVVFVLMIAFIIFMNNAERRVPIQYAKRVVGRKQYGGQNTFIPIKIAMSGVLPIIFAQSIASLPITIWTFIGMPKEGTVSYSIYNAIDTKSVIYMVVYFIMIIGFSYFYSSIQFNPVEIANNLKKQGGFIPGFRPGQPTVQFIQKVLNRITMFGAIYLGIVAICPLIVGKIIGNSSLAIGGTSVIIVVGVALETVKALENQMLMRQYKGFLE